MVTVATANEPTNVAAVVAAILRRPGDLLCLSAARSARARNND
jgi:hypothetical protein